LAMTKGWECLANVRCGHSDGYLQLTAAFKTSDAYFLQGVVIGDMGFDRELEAGSD
jgi:hypothetical protein